MFPNQATSGLNTDNPVKISNEVFAELVNDVKRQLEEEKRLKSLIPACNNGLTPKGSEESSEPPITKLGENISQVETSSNGSAPTFVPFRMDGNKRESSKTPEKFSIPPPSQMTDQKTFPPTASSFLPLLGNNPFLLTLPGLGDSGASLMSATGNPTTSTACAPSLATLLDGVTNFGAMPTSDNSVLSATGVGSSELTTSTGCVPSFESLLAGMYNFGAMPVLQNSALVLTTGDDLSTTSRRLTNSPVKKYPKLFHHVETVPTSFAPFGENGNIILPQKPSASSPLQDCEFRKFVSTAFQNSVHGDDLFQPSAPAPIIPGEMPILGRSVTVSEPALVSSEPVTLTTCVPLTPKTPDPNFFGGMGILENSALVSETAAVPSRSKTSDFPVLLASKEADSYGTVPVLETLAPPSTIAAGSSQPQTSAACPPHALIPSETNIFGGMSILENSALLDKIAELSSQPAAATAETKVSGTISISQKSAFSSVRANSSSKLSPSAASAPNAPTVGNTDSFGTIPNLKSSALLLAPPNESSQSTITKSAENVPLASLKTDTSVLTSNPVLNNSTLGAPILTVPTDTNIFGTIPILENSALLSAIANLSSKPPTSAVSVPFAATETHTSTLLSEIVPVSSEQTNTVACASLAPMVANSTIFPSMPVLDNSTLQVALQILQELQQTPWGMPVQEKMKVPSTSLEAHTKGTPKNIFQQPEPQTDAPCASYALAHLTALANSYNGFPYDSYQFYSSLPSTPSVSQKKKRSKERGCQNDSKSCSSSTKRNKSRPPTVLNLLAANDKCVQPILNRNIYSSQPSNRHPSKLKVQEQRKNIPLIDLTTESDQASRTPFPQTTVPIWFDGVQIVRPGSPFIERSNLTVTHSSPRPPPSSQSAPERQVDRNRKYQVYEFLKNEFGFAPSRNKEAKESTSFDTSVFLDIPDVDANSENYCYIMTGRMHPSNKFRTPPINFKKFLMLVDTEFCSRKDLYEIIISFEPNEQRFLKHCGQYSQWRYKTNLKCFQEFHRDFMNLRFVSLMSNNGNSNNLNFHKDMLRFEEKFNVMKELMTKDLEEIPKAKFCSNIMIDAANMHQVFDQNCRQYPGLLVFSRYNNAIVNRSLEPVMKYPKVDLPNYQVMHKTIDDAFSIVSAEITGISEEQINELHEFFKKDWAITGEMFEKLHHSSPKPQVPGVIAGAIFDRIRTEIQKVITENNYWWYLDNKPPVFD